MAKVFIVHGPQGSGKTMHKLAIARVLACTTICEMDSLDDDIDAVKWVGDYAVGIERTLVLTNREPFKIPGKRSLVHYEFIHIAEALRKVDADILHRVRMIVEFDEAKRVSINTDDLHAVLVMAEKYRGRING